MFVSATHPVLDAALWSIGSFVSPMNTPELSQKSYAMYHLWSFVDGFMFTPWVFTYAPSRMSTFLGFVDDQISHMFCEIHDAVSAVAAGFTILSEWPSERNWSVAQLSVAPDGWFPIVQYEGNVPSKPPTEGRSVA